jgi:4-diphosphocytidyl-2-C-methyl-D-erythritol kinase
MISFPNAKINLGLQVTQKRSDGYHNLETVFYPVALNDALEIVETRHATTETRHATSLPQCSFSGIIIDAPLEKNLVVKAYRLLQKDFDLPMIDMHLHKNIPSGAGLGGGSADAAFMLKMLNEMFALDISDEKLEEYAAALGADCAFFIKNKPVLASGIGNVFKKIEVDLSPYYIVIVKPPVFVSTAAAFAGITPKMPEISLTDILQEPIEKWKDTLVNDFEQSVFAQFPAIADVKTELYKQGAVYAAMSGSGSAVYGLFKEKTVCEKVFPPEYFIHQLKIKN